jgi:carbamoyl-phosphate synthase small subunit
MSKNAAILLLEDGTVFHGSSVGLLGTSSGEICFNTGMTGYQEIFSDPSYFGQLLVMASSHIGNYGTSHADKQSGKIQIAGLICKSFSQIASRSGDIQSLMEHFKSEGKLAIEGVDTRALVRHIRDKGAMNAIFSTEILDQEELKNRLTQVPSMNGLELSSKVSTKEMYELGIGNEFKVAAIDFGIKLSILDNLVKRNCHVRVFPMHTSLSEIMKFNPSGIFLSNGPGDPSVMHESISLVKEVTMTGLPVFGICLGHQLLALSNGLETKKMHNGHRGINHPVLNKLTGKGEITSQNHGFVVTEESVLKADNLELTHVHLNDNSVAGIAVKDKPIFSVQFHPEASPGPHDSRYLFDQFIANIKDHLN